MSDAPSPAVTAAPHLRPVSDRRFEDDVHGGRTAVGHPRLTPHLDRERHVDQRVGEPQQTLGVVGESAKAGLYVSNAPPVVTITSPTNNSIIPLSTTTLNYTATDPQGFAAGTQVSLDVDLNNDGDFADAGELGEGDGEDGEIDAGDAEAKGETPPERPKRDGGSDNSLDMIWSWRYGPEAGPNPWRAMTLEWQVSSPPPIFNFDEIPQVVGGPYEYGVPGARHAIFGATQPTPVPAGDHH